jgi:hypothetical protein
MSTINVNLMADSQGGSVAPISSVMRNRIINGAMVIDQRNAGVAVTTNDTFPVDRFRLSFANSTGAFSAQQTTTAPAGFVNSLKYTTTTADASLGATEYAILYQAIEGLNIADLGWGTASAKSVTLSFWVRSSVTGTFGGSLRNSAGNRSYPFTYTISAANTWEYETITIAGDTSGTWLTTNGVGIYLSFGMGVGSTLAGTAGAWAAANYIGATGAVNLIATLNADLYITGVQLEKGTQATSFEYRQYGQELALCQRYYQQVAGPNNYRVFGQFYNTTAGRVFCPAYVPFRAAPTITVTTLTGQAIGAGSTTFTATASTVLNTDAVSFDLTGGSPSRTTYQSLVFDGLLAMTAEL